MAKGQLEIAVKGRTYPLRYLMGGLLRFEQRTGQDISEADLRRFSTAITLLWCCLEATCSADGVALSITMEEMADALDGKTLASFLRMIKEDSEAAVGNVQGPTTPVPSGARG